MKEKIEEISLSMERGHRRILRVLSALAVIGLFAALWKWRGLAAMEPIVEGGQRRWLLAIGESIAVSLAAQWVLYLLPWPLLALFGSMALGLFASSASGSKVVKGGIKGVLPVLIIMTVLSLAARLAGYGSVLGGLVGIFIIVMLPIGILTSYVLWKKGKIQVVDKEQKEK